MTGIISKPGTHDKLRILSEDGQYDLACACGTKDQPGRTRGDNGKWIYPITLPNGGKSVLFKTLMSNVCTNDCKYCPLRENVDLRRCSLSAEETASAFMDYYRRKEVFGLFLSSAVAKSPDATMSKLNTVASILRKKHKFRGFIHLKIMAGASKAAIEQSLSLASAVSLNIETAGKENMAKLSAKKDYISDIIEPIKFISSVTGKGNRYHRVKQTTQFIVGPAGETDADIVKYMFGLYDRLKMHRIYFSAYQQQSEDQKIQSAPQPQKPEDTFTREHRLYQVDFLFRKYGFTQSDIACDKNGNLSLQADPKQVWATNHPEFFPVNVNKAHRNDLLKIPGIGPVTAKKIISHRKSENLNSISDIGKDGAILRKAIPYLKF
ncbi:MAG: radical SAM protein [Planctomycetes bacterium]|nr:radical SAM protein [Planctomycetota bacterium]